jgi:hypothetical protein
MFQPSSIEMFSQGILSIVTKPIAVFKPGQIRCQGRYWKAQLHQFSCHITLHEEQPVLVIGRENITMIVIPIQCVLWEQYMMDDFGLYLNASTLKDMQRYENF